MTVAFINKFASTCHNQDCIRVDLPYVELLLECLVND